MTGCLEEGFLPQIAGDYMAVFSVSFVSSVCHLQLRIVVLYTILGRCLVILGLFLGGREDLGAWDTAPLNEKARNGEEKKQSMKFQMTMKSVILHNN